MINRRQLLRGVLAGSMASAAVRAQNTAPPGGWFGRRRVPIGLQLHTVDEAARQDLDGTLEKVARIGYRTLELAGYHGHDVRTLRAAADRHGLKCTSIHVNAISRPGEPGLDQDISKLASELHVLGVTDVVLPTFPVPSRLGTQRRGESYGGWLERSAQAMTRDDWHGLAILLNDRGEKLRSAGMRLSYHNHNPEFLPLDDTHGLAVLMAETSPQDVSFQLDVGWAEAAGIDPVQLLLTHGRRFQLMHVKDIGAGTRQNFSLQQESAAVGSGRIEWRRILPVAFAAGVRKFYVEQEPPFAGDRFAAIENSYRYLAAFDA